MIDKEERIRLDKALAYFMGWRIDNSFPDKDRVWRKGNSVELETTFKFSTDWNWLMEVYDAIHKMEGYRVKMSDRYCVVFHFLEKKSETAKENFYDNTQEAVYMCFAHFAEYYNKSQIAK